VSSSVVGALVVVIGLGGLLAAQSPSHVHVSGHSTTLPIVSTTSRPKTNTTTTTRPPGKTTSTTTGTTPSPGTTPTTGTTPTADNHGGTTQPGPGATTPPPAAPSTTTYTSNGGRITVTFANGSLTLDSSTPSAGYQTDVHNDAPDDVEVRFDNGSRESRIRIRVQDGAIQKEITEN
jgi:cytoskeletal protein RodZ